MPFQNSGSPVTFAVVPESKAVTHLKFSIGANPVQHKGFLEGGVGRKIALFCPVSRGN
jgi:hypothetical protein